MFSKSAIASLRANPTDEALAEFVGSINAHDVSDALIDLGERPTSLAEVDLVISLIDLTTLEGTDTPARVSNLVKTALHPDPKDDSAPKTAAVCVYPDMVATARAELGARSGVKLAAVAGAFPSGRSPQHLRVAEVAYAVAQGADEIDIVIDRGAFNAGEYGVVYRDIVADREALARPDGTRAHLKVIQENCELDGGAQAVAKAATLSMLAGADFVKTSTGKGKGSATLADVAVMLYAVKDWFEVTGERIGVKPAGGIRTMEDAIAYLDLVADIVGEEWLTPDYFRFGASSLLDDVVELRQMILSGEDEIA